MPVASYNFEPIEGFSRNEMNIWKMAVVACIADHMGSEPLVRTAVNLAEIRN
jgi:hypothetical protein